MYDKYANGAASNPAQNPINKNPVKPHSQKDIQEPQLKGFGSSFVNLYKRSK